MSKNLLSEITTKIGSGATPKGGKNAYYLEGTPFIRSQNVLDFEFSDKGLAFINDEQANELNNVIVEKGDILLNITGDSIARTCIVPDKFISARVNQHVSIIRAKQGIDINYLFYYLQYLKPYLLKICGVGGTRNALTKTAIENLVILRKEKEKDIGLILRNLDKKIELNNKTNSELEAMAKTLYDYWFVQFDFPNEEGKPYKSSGGVMEWNEELKREIPFGWEVGTLLDIADYINGLACQKYRPNPEEEVLKVIKIKEMKDGFSDNTEFVASSIPERVKIENGDVLFSWSASLEVIVWAGGKGALNQHIFKVTSEKYPKSFYYFQLLNYLQHFKMMAENRKTTMGHITQEHLKQSRIIIPPYSIIKVLDKKISVLLEKITKNQEENQELSSLRDWLLPMLMNGQVKID